MARRRRLRSRRSWDHGNGTITIRIGSRRSPRRFYEITVTGPRDTPRFARLVDEQVRSFPRDPLVISVNGYQPWLEDVLATCIEDHGSEIGDLDRKVQFAGTMQFPEKASRRGKDVPWTFIVDHMNVPQVCYWSIDMEPPRWDDFGLPDISHYRFRIGPTPVSEHVVTELMFDYLYRDGDFDQPREDEEGICWLFSRLYWLLTDWQNIISEIVTRLNEAEANSHGRHLPVKTRTRLLHNEVDRLYELKEYLHFHTRAFKKLQKPRDDVPKREQKDPLWGDMDDAVEDLEQYDSTLDGLKERFNNLIELEFNIQSAVQSDYSQFLSIVATLFLPLSYLASIWGITTITWPAIWYLWAAIPVFIASCAFNVVFPWTVRQVQKLLYPVEELKIHLKPSSFTMLGDELPDNVDVPGGNRQGRVKHKAQRPAGGDDARARSRSRLRGEKDDGY